MNIYLIRHGRQNSRLCNVDVELSKEGREQADLLGKRLEKYDIDAVYSSQLIRAKETADIINSHLNKPRFIDERWQEADFGGMTGLSNEEMKEKYGDYQANFIGADEKKIYLTFDEGYEYGCTPQILDTLKEKGVKATFFVTEPYAKAQPELVQRMIDEGHEIGNHSVTHPSEGLPSQSLEQQKNEVMENHQYIKDNFGYDMHLFRFPAGKFSDRSLAVVNNCNYKSVFWSFAYKDYDVNNQPGESEALQKLKDRMHPGAIYLLHAESTTNTAILGRFIDAAQAAGYEVVAFQ